MDEFLQTPFPLDLMKTINMKVIFLKCLDFDVFSFLEFRKLFA